METLRVSVTSLELGSGGSEDSQPSPVLLSLSSPGGATTDAWRLVDNWHREAEIAMDRTGVPIDIWCDELEEYLQVMLARIRARAEAPTTSQQPSYEQASYQQSYGAAGEPSPPRAAASTAA